MYMYAGTHVCVCLSGSRKSTLDVASHMVLDAAFGTALELTFELGWLGRSPRDPPAPASSALGFQMHTIKPAFVWVFLAEFLGP